MVGDSIGTVSLSRNRSRPPSPRSIITPIQGNNTACCAQGSHLLFADIPPGPLGPVLYLGTRATSVVAEPQKIIKKTKACKGRIRLSPRMTTLLKDCSLGCGIGAKQDNAPLETCQETSELGTEAAVPSEIDQTPGSVLKRSPSLKSDRASDAFLRAQREPHDGRLLADDAYQFQSRTNNIDSDSPSQEFLERGEINSEVFSVQSSLFLPWTEINPEAPYGHNTSGPLLFPSSNIPDISSLNFEDVIAAGTPGIQVDPTNSSTMMNFGLPADSIRLSRSNPVTPDPLSRGSFGGDTFGTHHTWSEGDVDGLPLPTRDHNFELPPPPPRHFGQGLSAVHPVSSSGFFEPSSANNRQVSLPLSLCNSTTFPDGLEIDYSRTGVSSPYQSEMRTVTRPGSANRFEEGMETSLLEPPPPPPSHLLSSSVCQSEAPNPEFLSDYAINESAIDNDSKRYGPDERSRVSERMDLLFDPSAPGSAFSDQIIDCVEHTPASQLGISEDDYDMLFFSCEMLSKISGVEVTVAQVVNLHSIVNSVFMGLGSDDELVQTLMDSLQELPQTFQECLSSLMREALKSLRRSCKESAGSVPKKSTFLRLGFPTGTWLPWEELRLIEAVERLRAMNWRQIGQLVNSFRSADQCSQHWLRVMDPVIRKGPWDPSEDLSLIKLIEKFGINSWTTIAKHIPGRTGSQVRYRGLALIKNGVIQGIPGHNKKHPHDNRKHGSFTDDEDHD